MSRLYYDPFVVHSSMTPGRDPSNSFLIQGKTSSLINKPPVGSNKGIRLERSNCNYIRYSNANSFHG